MPYSSKKYPFSMVLQLCFKEMFAKGKNSLSNFLQAQPIIGALRRQGAGEQVLGVME
jgi:hypothetical protein